MGITLRSDAFADGGAIPRRYGEDGEDLNRSWDEVRPDLERGWREPVPWSEYEPLVRRGWERRATYRGRAATP